LCLTTPRAGSLSYHVMGRRWTHYKEEHLQYFSDRAIAHCLERAGLRVIGTHAWPKAVNLDYVNTQFTRYRHWLWTPAVTLATRVSPAALRSMRLSLLLGDMIAFARRP